MYSVAKTTFLISRQTEAYNDLLSTEIVKKMKTLQSEKPDLLLKYTLKMKSTGS